VDQDLYTLTENVSSSPVFSVVLVTRSLVLRVIFVDHCFSFFFWSLCCPCYMPKYVPMLDGIMHSPSGRALCLQTVGHISDQHAAC
jgi:hypothetical protein